MTYDLVVRGGTLVTPQGTERADLAVEGERIAAIGVGLRGREVVPAEGTLVLPGAIDAHTHMDLPVGGTRSSDDFESGTVAAACGGVTTLIDFTVGSAQTSIPEDIERRLAELSGAAVDVALHGEVVGRRPSDEELAGAFKRGVTSFKFYTAYAASGRRSTSTNLRLSFRVLARLGATALVHCEDEGVIEAILGTLTSTERGRMETLARARPARAEALAIDEIASLSRRTGASVHVVHVSSALGLEAVARAKRDGTHLTAETCPQYLLLTEAVYRGPDGHLYAASPPLRQREDQEALWEGLRSGLLDLVASDHCPFTRAQKTWRGSFLDLPYGLPGVETLLPLLHSEGVAAGRLPLTALPRLLSAAPARVHGLFPAKGSLAVGADADIVVFDPYAEWTVSADRLHMRTDFSPYEGRRVRGDVAATVSRGRVVYAGGSFRGEPGWGRFVPRRGAGAPPISDSAP